MTQNRPSGVSNEPILVYLCTGKTIVLPGAGTVTFRDDKIVCSDSEGVVVAIFPSAAVYMCSRKQIPAAPL